MVFGVVVDGVVEASQVLFLGFFDFLRGCFMPGKYSQEFRNRVVGLVFDRLRDDPGVSRAAIISDTGLKLGVSRGSLRRWVV